MPKAPCHRKDIRRSFLFQKRKCSLPRMPIPPVFFVPENKVKELEQSLKDRAQKQTRIDLGFAGFPQENWDHTLSEWTSSDSLQFYSGFSRKTRKQRKTWPKQKIRTYITRNDSLGGFFGFPWGLPGPSYPPRTCRPMVIVLILLPLLWRRVKAQIALSKDMSFFLLCVCVLCLMLLSNYS